MSRSHYFKGDVCAEVNCPSFGTGKVGKRYSRCVYFYMCEVSGRCVLEHNHHVEKMNARNKKRLEAWRKIMRSKEIARDTPYARAQERRVTARKRARVGLLPDMTKGTK